MKTFVPALISVFVLLADNRPASACTLMPQPIPSTLRSYPDRIVAFGTVSRVEAQFSEFKLAEVLDGSGLPGETIRIWDEKDFECNGVFPLGSEMLGEVGDTVLFIAPRIIEVKNPWDVAGDYRMPRLHHLISVFNFRNGKANYNDITMKEHGNYTSVEMKALVKSHLGPTAIRGQSSRWFSAFRVPIDLFRDRDLNGRLGR